MAVQSLVPVSSVLASHGSSFTAEGFGRIRGLIYRHIDISLSDRKGEMAYSRSARRLRVVSFGLFCDYPDALEKGHLPDEWEAFTNVLTTNLAVFSHEQYRFPILYEHAKVKRMPPTVWCSASLTGEEPYSTTITLVEALGSVSPSQVSVIVPNMNANALVRARAGTYPMERVVVLSPERLKKYFLRNAGKQEGYARV